MDNPKEQENPYGEWPGTIIQASKPGARILIGNCPGGAYLACGEPVIVVNNGEVWPLIDCRFCYAQYPTTMLQNAHIYNAGNRNVDSQLDPANCMRRYIRDCPVCGSGSGPGHECR